MSVLVLHVEPQVGVLSYPELVNRVRLLAPHVDEVRINTVGVGFAVADQLRDLGDKLVRLHPLDRSHD